MQDKASPPAPGETLLNWQASEYVSHSRKPGWYVALLAITLLLVLALVFVGELFSAVVVVLMTAAIWVYARRTPEVLNYSLHDNGVRVGEKFYPYNEFRAYAVLADKGLYSLELEPTRRFMPRLSIFCDPESLEQITDTLSAHLPHEERQPDLIDRVSRHLKF